MLVPVEGLGAWLGALRRGCKCLCPEVAVWAQSCARRCWAAACKPSQCSCSILQGSNQQSYPCPTVILYRENVPGGDAQASAGTGSGSASTEPRAHFTGQAAAQSVRPALCATASGPAEGAGLWEGERKGEGVAARSRGSSSGRPWDVVSHRLHARQCQGRETSTYHNPRGPSLVAQRCCDTPLSPPCCGCPAAWVSLSPAPAPGAS